MTYQERLAKLSIDDYINLVTFLEVSDAYQLTDRMIKIRQELLAMLKPD